MRVFSLNCIPVPQSYTSDTSNPNIRSLGTISKKSKMATQPVEKNSKSKRSLFLQIKEGISDWVLMSPSSKAAIYWLVVLAGSFIHDFLPLPQSYLSNKRNVFNVYFVKLGWGWTLGLLIPFMSLTSFAYTSCNPTAMLKHLSRLAVGTFGWYFWVNLFVYIEELTGFCEGEDSLTSKRSCHLQGFHWDGFDISGHAFLLTHSALIISEEIQVKQWLPALESEESVGRRPHILLSPLIDLLFAGSSMLLILWEFMLVCTTVYFHNVQQKVFGALIALFTWHVTYGIWYKSDPSPGVPWVPHKRF